MDVFDKYQAFIDRFKLDWDLFYETEMISYEKSVQGIINSKDRNQHRSEWEDKMGQVKQILLRNHEKGFWLDVRRGN